MQTSEIPAQHCPGCGSAQNRASTLEQTAPGPGDLVVCARCGFVSRLDDQLRCRAASEDELRVLAREQPDAWRKICSMQRIVRIRLDEVAAREEMP